MIAVGDIVRLRSGGPRMTVTHTRNNRSTIECTWFDEAKTHTIEVPPKCLRRVRWWFW